METVDRIAAVMADRSASDWLRVSLETALSRDPVDAANDAEFLAELLASRAADALRAAPIFFRD